MNLAFLILYFITMTDNVEYQGNGTWTIHHPKMINELIENQVESGIPAPRPGDWDSVGDTPPQN